MKTCDLSMDIQYVYQKERRDFGKQCYFGDRNDLVFSEGPNRGFFKEYILRNPTDRETQKSRQMSASEANTERAVFEHKGVNHTEGGWPKDVNLADPEQTVRYKRKIEKDESYIVQVMSLTKVNSPHILCGFVLSIKDILSCLPRLLEFLSMLPLHKKKN